MTSNDSSSTQGRPNTDPLNRIGVFLAPDSFSDNTISNITTDNVSTDQTSTPKSKAFRRPSLVSLSSSNPSQSDTLMAPSTPFSNKGTRYPHSATSQHQRGILSFSQYPGLFSRSSSPSPSENQHVFSFSHSIYSKFSSKYHSHRHLKSLVKRRIRFSLKKGSLNYSNVLLDDRRAASQTPSLSSKSSLQNLKLDDATLQQPSSAPCSAAAPIEKSASPSLTPLPPTTTTTAQDLIHISENVDPDLIPPVNVSSLQEIELQEVVRNPQLRHDVVFDPQLQFRPNLEGERGHRKKLATEQYWTSVVAECEALALTSSPEQASLIIDAPKSKLRHLFITLREVLDSLLPARDRDHVSSILDIELLVQQLRQGVFDFTSLATWLSTVFKSHCAPMRDAWVDQMVSKVEQGVASQSPQLIVEGLRMIFAILEAMKLDVVNHQIRTLRPVMLENAIEFEHNYYARMLEKKKLDIDDSLEWYSNNLSKYTEKQQQQQAKVKSSTNLKVRYNHETYRSAFVRGLVILLACASDELVTQFPSTFSFDFIRLATFRAEVRQLVCINICLLQYTQLVHAELVKNKHGLNNLERQRCLNDAVSNRENIEKLKKDILAIVSDDYGNSKWAKNSDSLALELAKRVEIACTPGTNKAGNTSASTIGVVPSQDLINMSTSLLTRNMQPTSPLFRLVETKIVGYLTTVCTQSMNSIAALDKSPILSRNNETFNLKSFGSSSSSSSASGAISSNPEVACQQELLSTASKLLILCHFHWEVFHKFYIQYATTTNAAVIAAAASGRDCRSDDGDVSSTHSSSTIPDDDEGDEGRRSVKRPNGGNEKSSVISSNTSSVDNKIIL